MSYLEILSGSDSRLAQVIKTVGNYAIETHDDSFKSLIKSIIYQQLAGKAANAIFQRLISYFDGSFPTPIQILNTNSDLYRNKIGLSYRKITYIKDLSSKIISGELDLDNLVRLSDEEVILELVKVKGIGRWTAEMFLIFCLKREDIFPAGDLGIKKAIKILYDLDDIPTHEFMVEKSTQWKPYRSIATWYLWKSLDKFGSLE